MSDSHIELPSYKEALQLAKGEKLSGVHEIYYTLAKNIKNLGNRQNSKTFHQYLDKIIHPILLGDAIHSDMLPAMTLDGFNLYDLTHVDNNIKKAKEFIYKANDEYQQYCDSLLQGFTDILTTYKHFQTKGTGFFGVLNRIVNHYSYNGNYSAKKYQAFINLIDHLALLDVSGVFIEQLLISLEKKKTFYYQDQADFLDEIYLIFSQLQENYFLNLQQRDEQIIQKLIQQYKIKQEYLSYFKKYYDYVIHGRGVQEEFLPHICLTPQKLHFDIQQIRDETNDSHDKFKNSSEQLQDKIHQVAEGLGLHLRIKKQIEKIEEDEKSHQEQAFYEKFYYLEKNLAEYEYLISQKEQEDRAIKKTNKKLGKYFSIIISMGEAFVSAAAIVTVYLACPPIAIGLMVWFSAAFINRLLFKGDIQDGLDDLFLKVEFEGKLYRKIFCYENGKPLSKKDQVKIMSAGILCVATGIVCGALSFMSSYAIWPSILGFLSIHGTTLAVLGIAFSAGPASLMAVGITYLFGKVIADFIRKDRGTQILKYINDFFIKPWKAMGPGDGLEKAKHIGKCVGRVFLLTLAVGITVAATVASMGVFYQQTLSFLGAVAMSGPAQWMKKIAQIATWVNAMISMPFQIEGTNKVFQPPIQRHTFAKLSQENVKKMSLSHVQKDAARARTIGKVMVAGTAMTNGLSMGELNKIPDSSSLNSLHLNKLTGSASSTMLSNTTLAAAAIYSIGPNMNAGFYACDQEKVDPLEDEIKITNPQNQLKEEKVHYNVHSSRLWSQYKSTQLENRLGLKRNLRGG